MLAISARRSALGLWPSVTLKALSATQLVFQSGLAFLLGCMSWGQAPCVLTFLPLVTLLWARSGSRRSAFLVMASYYLGASRGLLGGASVFFQDPDGMRSWWSGAVIWIAPNALLAAVWASAWGPQSRAWRALAALAIVSAPPIGVVGWANPLTSAGDLFPGLGWLGLCLTLALTCSIASAPSWRVLAALGIAMAAAGAAKCIGVADVTSTAWMAIDTKLGKGADEGGDGFDQMQRLQREVESAAGRAPVGAILVLPELVAGDWSVDRTWWSPIDRILKKRGQTVVVGAHVADVGSRKSVNALFTIGAAASVVMPDRVPVPVSMWRPWSAEGTRADWFAPGVGRVGTTRVGHLVCYEQLLIWPALVSAAGSPDVLVGAANDWWARGTSVPVIQRQAVAAWGRLFGLPVVFASNE